MKCVFVNIKVAHAQNELCSVSVSLAGNIALHKTNVIMSLSVEPDYIDVFGSQFAFIAQNTFFFVGARRHFGFVKLNTVKH